MSIVIPAGHLAHTVITVRCDSPHAAPHIECGLDGQASFASSSREPLDSPEFSSDAQLRAANETASSLTSNPGAAPRADLSVERGMDHRGHFVRLSFLPAQQTSQVYNQRLLGRRMADASLPLEGGLTGPSHRLALPQEPSPFRTPALAPPASMCGSPLAYSQAPIMNDTRLDANTSCLENMNFMCPSDVELLNAFDSFMGILDTPSSDSTMLDLGVPGDITNVPYHNHHSEPASPEMSSASSSSCGSLSPTTPFDCFLPVVTPAASGNERNPFGGGNNANDVRLSSDRHLQSSPVPPPLAPSPKLKAQPPNKTESRLLPCPQPGCKRQFKSTSTLGGHMKTHAGKGVRFPCSFPPCTEKFSRRHDQLRHEVYKHGKQCEWVCSRCNSFFSYERSLEKHTCTMDKSRRGSMPASISATSRSALASGAGR